MPHFHPGDKPICGACGKRIPYLAGCNVSSGVWDFYHRCAFCNPCRGKQPTFADRQEQLIAEAKWRGESGSWGTPISNKKRKADEEPAVPADQVISGWLSMLEATPKPAEQPKEATEQPEIEKLWDALEKQDD